MEIEIELNGQVYRFKLRLVQSRFWNSPGACEPRFEYQFGEIKDGEKLELDSFTGTDDLSVAVQNIALRKSARLERAEMDVIQQRFRAPGPNRKTRSKTR